VHANHFKSRSGWFDEGSEFHPDRAMADLAPEVSGSPGSSYYRFWSGMWAIKENYGRIDDKLMREELAPSHVRYDEHGNRTDPDPKTGVPPRIGDTYTRGLFCEHAGPRTVENPMGVAGNAETTVFDLTTREVWWVPVWPCHYRARNLSWHYLDLKPFAELRRFRDASG
jgi:hypothetical protein